MMDILNGGLGNCTIKVKCLNFGCGKAKLQGYDNADITNNGDIVFDFNKFPYPIKDNTYKYIYCNHVLEHLEDTIKVMQELWRISEPGAIIEINVPHLNSEGAFSEIGHIRYFTKKSFEMISNPAEWRDNNFKLKLLSLYERPTTMGKFLFLFRRKWSLIIRGVYDEINVKFEVIKKGANK